MTDTTNCDMGAEREHRDEKTDLEMENVRLRRLLMEAKVKAFRLAGRADELRRERDRLSDDVQKLLRENADLMAEGDRETVRPITEKERRVLDMWPRYEDTGEPVMFRDSVEHDGTIEKVQGFKLYGSGPAFLSVVGVDAEKWLRIEDYRSVKRPAPEVLDADGVPIHVGDKVWHDSGCASGVVTSIDAGSLMHTTRYVDERGTEFRDAARNLTHARPDSWERLEEDAVKEACDYFGFKDIVCDVGKECPAYKHGVECDMSKTFDIIRRAKKLAVVE